jgi:hypothetical protein
MEHTIHFSKQEWAAILKDFVSGNNLIYKNIRYFKDLL